MRGRAHARDAAHRSPAFIEAQIALAAALGHLGRDAGTDISIDGFHDRAPDYVRTHILYCQDLKDRLHKPGFLELNGRDVDGDGDFLQSVLVPDLALATRLFNDPLAERNN